ncbi:MAG TPA: hypothetical protein VKU19_09755 [Bryobacteraceae bacterium]|nr:hypothetical protein [Bryobacteraceae bacterium]
MDNPHPSAAFPGDWLQFRSDRKLTGRSRLVGSITSPPRILWSVPIGARQTWVAFQSSAGNSASVNLPAVDSNAGALAANSTWGIGPPAYDLNHNGSPVVFPAVDSQTKIGNFIPGSTNFQEVQFDSCFNQQNNNATNCVGAAGVSGHLYQWQNGSWVEQWKTPPISRMFVAQTIVGDFDHDGKLEVAAEPWYDLQVYDLLTGALKTSAQAIPDNVLTGREYGWLGAYDLNGDGMQEFVAIGLFENFISVMGWKDGQLIKLWDHTIEIVHDLAQTIHATTTYPVQDIDGDGILDVVTSIYNENGDKQWHVVARDGMTGDVLLDQPGRYLLGMTDVNADGAAELFTIATTGQLTPQYGTLDVVSFKGRTLTTLLELSGTGLATQQVQNLPLNINTESQLLNIVAGPVTKGGLPAFFTSRLVDAAHGTIELTPWQWSNGKLAKLGTITGPHLQVLATRPADPGSPGFLISAAVSGNNSGSIAISGVSGTVVQSSVMRAPLSSAVVGHLRPQDPPTVIVQDALDELVAFRPSSATGSGTIVWTHAGHGASTGDATGTGQNESAGALLASLTGDGTLQTLAETTGASGQARIVAIQPDGSDLWTSDFSGFPAASPAQNEPGVTLLYAGRFRNADREDVVVSTRSETITTDEINLVDGSSGQLVWNDKNGSDPSLIPAPTHDDTGFGWHAVYDWDHNGLDDLVGFTLNYWVKNGTDQNLFDRYLVSPSVAVENTIGLVFPPDSSWPTEFYPVAGIPVIGDFLNNGTDTILYGGSQYLLGLIDPLSGKGIWQSPAFPGLPGYLQGIADLDGDGTLSLVSAGAAAPDGSAALSVNRASTGELLWSIPLPGCVRGGQIAPGPVSVGDINGDGRDEAVFTCGTNVYAVGADPGNRSGKILWTLNLGTGFDRSDSPILADAEGNGRLEIIVVGSNGYIYGIGSLPSTAPISPNAPVIEANGVVDGAAFLPGKIAPGSWFTIKGTKLSDGKYQAAAVPLPQQLGGTVVTVNGQIARLSYVDTGQINAEMPPDMPVGPASVVVTNKAGSSGAATVQIVPAMPEIFQYSGNRAVAQNVPDYSLNSPDNPISAGGSLVVYFTGGGLVNGDRRIGIPASLTTQMPLRLATTVMVGSQQAQLVFSGLTPGAIGLYQVNATVPASLSPGEYPVTITVGGVTSSTAVISVK